MSVAVRVQIVDPSAYTPPYDHALCSALASAGAGVELFTSRFAHGPVAEPRGYTRTEFFYRAAARLPAAGARRAVKLVEHVPDMLRYRRAARRAAGSPAANVRAAPVAAISGNPPTSLSKSGFANASAVKSTPDWSISR